MSQRNLLVVAAAALAAVVAWMLLKSPDPAPAAPSADAMPFASDDGVAGTPGRPSPSASASTSETTVTVTGHVEGDGKPLAGAVVMLRAHDDPESGARQRIATTDDGGGFSFDDVAAGRYAVAATAKGFVPGVQRRLDIDGREPAPLTIALQAGGLRIHGVVEDMTGGPIDGAFVRAVPTEGYIGLRQHESFGTVGDEDGAYELFVAPGRYRLEVEHPDYATDSRGVEISGGESQQNFRLVPTASIEGVVRNGVGGPVVAGATVRWMRERMMVLPDGSRHATPAGGGMVTTDDAGKFRITGLPPGVVQLSARARKRASLEPTEVAVAIAEQVTGVELVVDEAHDVRGRVVDAAEPDKGIANANVTLRAGGPGAMGTQTDAEGNFELRGVLPGSYTVDASADGYALSLPGMPVEVDGDVDDVRVELSAGLTITGRVEPPQLASVRIDLRPEQMRMGGAIFLGGAGMSAVETDDDGTFELGPVQPGNVVVVATAADGNAGETEVTIGPEGATDVVVRLQPRASVRGSVRGLDGTPIAQGQVSLRRKQPDGQMMRLTINGREMGTSSAITGDDGSFQIDGVAADTYDVVVSDRYGDELQLRGGPVALDGPVPRLEVGSTDLTAVDLTVDAHDGVIRGKVTTDGGGAAADVWVTLTRLPDPPPPRSDDDHEPGTHMASRMIIATSDGGGAVERPPALTGEDGRFEFTGLREGNYQVTAEGDGGRSRTSAEARTGEAITLTLQPLAAVEGRAMLDGEPMTTFFVSAAGPSSRSRQVRDEEGRYRLDRLDPGEYELTVRATGGALGKATFTVRAGDTASADIVLERPAKVRGRLVDDAGGPVVGAMIMVGEGSEEKGEVRIEHSGSDGLITTDDDGKFDFTCPAGGRVLVAIEPGKQDPLALKFFSVQAGDDLDLGELGPGDAPPPPPGSARVEEDVDVAAQ